MMFPVRNAMATRQAGFTLIEVLVAFLILSIGLLGVVALIVQSKVSQHQAVQRTRAVALADEMIERIRINPAQIETYNIGLDPVGAGVDTPEPTPNCATNTCTPEQMAVHDLWSWEQSLQGQAATINGEAADGLVTPRGCIVFEPAASRERTGQLTVIVEWRGLVETTDALEEGDEICGGESAGEDKYRRQVAVNTYVIDETEL